MEGKNLLKYFWAEAVHTTVYTLNWSSTKVVWGLRPYEAWFKRKPNIKHLKIFGCIAYAHIPKENRKKLDGKKEKCIFIWYSDKSKDYRLYKAKSKKLIIPRYVIFDEESEWRWDNSLQLVLDQSPSFLQKDQEHTQEGPSSSSPLRSPSSISSQTLNFGYRKASQEVHRSDEIVDLRTIYETINAIKQPEY